MGEGVTAVQVAEALKSAGFDSRGLVASLRLELDEGAGREFLGTRELGREAMGAFAQAVENAEVEAAFQHKRLAERSEMD
eukprot:1983394-Amphidinium_carterae.1